MKGITALAFAGLVLSSTAYADDERAPAVDMGETITLGSARSVAEEFMVLPEGFDIGGRLRTITADGGLGPAKLKLTDLALFDASVQWAIANHVELDATVTMLPKQPSTTSEHIFQGGSLAIQRDVTGRTAIAISGSAAPLAGMPGQMIGDAAFALHKHRLNEVVTFSLAGGASSTWIRTMAPADRPFLVEVGGHANVLARIPNGVWGGWMGVGYSVPVFKRGVDPVSGLPIAPQPRLDLSIGNAVQLADHWDLTAELQIIDRGDLANPATRLPVLDGGFDQIQLIVGVSRRFSPGQDRVHDPLIQL